MNYFFKKQLFFLHNCEWLLPLIQLIDVVKTLDRWKIKLQNIKLEKKATRKWLKWLDCVVLDEPQAPNRLEHRFPSRHILVDSPSIRRRNSTLKVHGNYIDFEGGIHVEIMTSIRRGYFDVDSTFKIDEISMSFPRGFFYVVSTSNRRNFCTRCFYSIIF